MGSGISKSKIAKKAVTKIVKDSDIQDVPFEEVKDPKKDVKNLESVAEEKKDPPPKPEPKPEHKPEPKPEKKQDEKIKLDSKLKPSDDGVKFGSIDEDELMGSVKKQTERAKDKISESDKEIEEFKGKTREQLNREIDELEKSSQSLQPTELFDVAFAIEEVFDLFISFILKVIAKDTSDTAYQISKEKKNLIAKNLAMVMAKYQAKIGVVPLFLMSILAAYVPAIITAFKRRKTWKEGNQANDKSESPEGDVQKPRGKGRPPKN